MWINQFIMVRLNIQKRKFGLLFLSYPMFIMRCLQLQKNYIDKKFIRKVSEKEVFRTELK